MPKTYLVIAFRGRCFSIDKKNCLTSVLLVTTTLIISLFPRQLYECGTLFFSRETR